MSLTNHDLFHISVRVLVEDENDNSPSFNVSSFSLSILENTTVGVTLLRVAASDDDEGYNGDVRYSFIGDGTKFAIDTTTGGFFGSCFLRSTRKAC